MEMDFVQLEHRPNIATLMEACSIDLETALHLYYRHHYDLQAAISEKLGLVSPQRVPPSPRDHLTMSFEDDGDYEFQRYCRFVEEGPGFLKRYPLPPEKKSSSTQNHSFKRDLENFLGRKISLTIEGGKIEDGLRWSWKHKFPVALLLLDFQKSNLQVTEALSDSFLSDLGTCFRVYGMDPSSCRIDQWLSRFIVLPADSNSLLLFRINFLDQIETLAKIQLGAADLKTRVQRAKSEGIQHELDEAHIIKQHALMRTGRPYHRPQPIRQKIKQREDAKLRKQQDDEFIKACLPRNNLPQSQPRPMVSLEQLKAKRQERRGRLKVYDEGMQVKLRMPSGKAILLFIAETEPVQYLFDFVDTSPQDIGFERDHQRRFDIVYGPNKNKSLQQQRDSTIGSVLEECQVVIVKETDE